MGGLNKEVWMRIQQLPKSHISHFQTIQRVCLGQLWSTLAKSTGRAAAQWLQHDDAEVFKWASRREEFSKLVTPVGPLDLHRTSHSKWKDGYLKCSTWRECRKTGTQGSYQQGSVSEAAEWRGFKAFGASTASNLCAPSLFKDQHVWVA